MNARTTDIDKSTMTLRQRWWRRAILPGLSLPLLSLALVNSLVSPHAGLLADEPPVVAELPDEGQPPAPDGADVPATEQPDSPPAATEPVVTEPVTTEPVTTESVATEPAAAATSTESESVAAESPVIQSETTSAVTSNTATSSTATSSAAQAEVASEEQLAEPEVRGLSVPPVEQTKLLPKNRPAWIGSEPDVSNSIHLVYVGSLPMSTEEEAESSAAIDGALITAMDAYLSNNLKMEANCRRLVLSASEIRENLVDAKSSVVLPLETRGETLFQKWVVLNVTEAQRQDFQQRYHQLRQRERLALLGVGLAAFLGLTGIVNLAFTRRKSRYPSLGLPPATMPLLSAMAGYDHNQAQVVQRELPVIQAPRRRCCTSLKSGLIFMVAVGMVLALFIPRAAERHEAQRVEIHHEAFEDAGDFHRDLRDHLRQEIQEALGHD